MYIIETEKFYKENKEIPCTDEELAKAKGRPNGFIKQIVVLSLEVGLYLIKPARFER